MKKSNPLCVFDDVRPYVEEVFLVKDMPHLLRMSKQGHAPKYYRTGTQRSSPPLFKKKDWLEFAISRWGSLRPDLIRAMVEAGWGLDPDASPPSPRNSKRKRKVRS